MSEPLGHATNRSVRRCRRREDALILLSSLGEAHPRALAQGIGVDNTRLRWIMHGHPPQYKVELSLVALGLARYERTAEGWRYVITSRGRVKARQLTSRHLRDAAGRRARAEAGRKTVRDAGEVAAVAAVRPSGAGTPNASYGFTCTYT